MRFSSHSNAAAVCLAVIGAAQVIAQTAVAPPDQFFDSGGVRIRFVEQGSGAAVVLMHGYTGALDRVLIGSEDRNAAGVPALVKVHRHIRSLVVQGAQHGGAEGVMRRPEFMSALREFLAQR